MADMRVTGRNPSATPFPASSVSRRACLLGAAASAVSGPAVAATARPDPTRFDLEEYLFFLDREATHIAWELGLLTPEGGFLVPHTGNGGRVVNQHRDFRRVLPVLTAIGLR